MSQPSVVTTLIELLRIKSFTNDEGAICDWMSARLKNQLAGAQGVRIERIKNALIVYGPMRRDRKTLAFAGHFDTVFGQDFGERVRDEGDKIVGLGASDMKAGLAVMTELLTREVIERSRFNLAFVFYDAEEGDHQDNGILRVLPGSPDLKGTDLCFVLEPTENALQLGCTGVLNVKVTFRGKRAHAARPWEGENALHKAGLLLTKLDQLNPESVDVAGLNYRNTITATVAATGGTSRNVVPDEFVINLNVRFSPLTSVASAKNWVKEIVGDGPEIEVVDEAPSGAVPTDNSLLNEFEARYKLRREPKQAYTDVAMFSAYGIPAINCGPGLPSQAHQQGEYVSKKSLLASLAMYREFLLS